MIILLNFLSYVYTDYEQPTNESPEDQQDDKVFMYPWTTAKRLQLVSITCVHLKFYSRYIAGDILTVATLSKTSSLDFQLHDVTSGNILGR